MDDILRRLREQAGSFVQKRQQRGLSQRITGKDILPFQQQRQQIGQNVSNFMRQGITNIGNTRLENLPAPNLMPIQKLRSQVKAQPYTPTIREQFTKTIAQPITTAFDRNKSPLDRGIGAVQGAFNSTPMGQAWQIGTGGVSGILKTRRQGGDLTANIRKGISNPMADIATEGLGVQNPFLALGINVLSGNPKSAVKGIGKLRQLKNVKQLGIKGVNPKAFDLDEPSLRELEQIVDTLKISKGRTPKQLGDAREGLQNFLQLYAPGYQNATNRSALKVAEAVLDRRYKVESPTNFPKMGFAQADDVKPNDLGLKGSQSPDIMGSRSYGNKMKRDKAAYDAGFSYGDSFGFKGGFEADEVLLAKQRSDRLLSLIQQGVPYEKAKATVDKMQLQPLKPSSVGKVASQESPSLTSILTQPTVPKPVGGEAGLGLRDQQLNNYVISKVNKKYGVQLTPEDIVNADVALKKYPQLQSAYNSGELTTFANNVGKEYLSQSPLKSNVPKPVGEEVPELMDVNDVRAIPNTAWTKENIARADLIKRGEPIDIQGEPNVAKPLLSDIDDAGNALLKPKEAQQLTPEVNQAVEQVGQKLKLKQEPIGGIVSEATPKTLDKVRIRTQQAKAKQAQNEFNEWQKQLFAREGGTRTTSGAVRDASKAVGGNTRSMAARDITDLKDISSPATQLVDVFRNFRKVYGKRYEDVKKVVLDPLFVKGKTGLLDDQEMWIKKISNEVETGFGIKKGSKQSADVQKFGEGLIDEAGLVSKYGRKGANTIVEADKWFRKNYDQLLNEVNAVRAKIYPNNPDKIIPKRQDYYRHFNELSQGIDGLLNTLGRAVDVSPQLAGISYKTKPKSKWLSFAQRRVGGKTEFDAVGGFIDYVKAQTYAKHIDPHIDTFRQLSRELGEAGVEQNKGLNNFSLFLEKFADDLSGKTGTLDRAIQEIGGRKPMAVLNWVNQRVKANVILGNASSSIAQFFNLPNGIADAGPQFATKGFARAVGSMFKKNRPQDQSVFLRERYFKGFEKFDRSMIDNGRKFAAWMITAGDEISTKAMWNMQYEKGLAQGLKGQQLINFADEVTRRMVAGRGIGEMALIQRSKAFQLFAPFQVEVTNAWYVIGDMIGEKAFGKLATLALTSYIMNRAAEQIRGSDVSFDPVQAVAEGIEAFNEEDDKKVGALRLAGRVGGEFLSNVPVGQTAAAAYPEYGFKVGEFEAPTREDFFGEGDPTRFGSGLLAMKALQDPLFMAVPPYAGQQLKRTIDGISTSVKGYSETPGGDVRFPVNNSPIRDVQRAIFGQYSTPEAREYFDKDRRKLGSNQSEIFKSLEGADRENYYETTMSNREKENAIDKLKEEVKVSGASTSVGDTFVYYDKDSGEAKTLDVSKFREEPEGALAKAKWDNDRWNKAKEIFNSPLENKDEIIESMGIDPSDVAYYDLASQNNQITSTVLIEEIGSMMSTMKDRGELINYLVKLRREVNGQMVLTSGVIDDLEDEGIISDAEAKQLKKIEFGKDGSPKVKMTGRGKSAKLKFVKPNLGSGFNVSTSGGGSVPKQAFKFATPEQIQNITTIKAPSIRIAGAQNVPKLPSFNVKFNL